MNQKLLELLRCPFCGGALKLEQSSSAPDDKSEISSGILGCQCCAYPVVLGIPYLRTGGKATAALDQITQGKINEAAFTLLELDESKQPQVQNLLDGSQSMPFRDALKILSPNPEGEYFLYRFSDPTFLVSDALLRGVVPYLNKPNGWILDLCGGAGHLTRSLCQMKESSNVVLADFSFWKIWIAKRFIAPQCHPVCCNANDPLPFVADKFSLVLCSGAFEYIWPRRLLAGEMSRLVGSKGMALITHTHNSLCENHCAGMPLDPAGYRNLFETTRPRLFKESAILDAVLSKRPIDLSSNYSDEELKNEPALICIATQREELFRSYENVFHSRILKSPAINPLYQTDAGDSSRLKLKFTSSYYEEEFAEVRRYLPEKVVLSSAQLAALETGHCNGELDELVEHHVVLDLPKNYL